MYNHERPAGSDDRGGLGSASAAGPHGGGAERIRRDESQPVEHGLTRGWDRPDDYVSLELQGPLRHLPERLEQEDRAVLRAWLLDRRGQPDALRLCGWQEQPEHYYGPPSDMTGEDPRRVTIFRSRLRGQAAESYGPVAEEMESLARAIPGFVEIKTFTADDGERVSLVTFASEEAQRVWRDDPRHKQAQNRGRSEFYDEYQIQVCRIVRERGFVRDGDAAVSPRPEGH